MQLDFLQFLVGDAMGRSSTSILVPEDEKKAAGTEKIQNTAGMQRDAAAFIVIPTGRLFSRTGFCGDREGDFPDVSGKKSFAA